MLDLSKLDEINDEAELQKLLSSTQDLDERKKIRAKLLAVKEEKSKERQKELEEREKRREEEIAERKSRKVEEKKAEVKRLEDLAKTSTADRIETESSKQRDQYIKDKAKAAEEEKKQNIEHFEELAKQHKAANEKNDSVEQKLIEQKSSWSAEDKKRDLEKLDSISEAKMEGSKVRNVPTGAVTSKLNSVGGTSNSSAKPKTTAAAFAMFQNKDKEAGGTGKATPAVTVPASTVANNNPNNPQTIKENLLKWCQMHTQGYPEVNVTNFSSSWANGMAFCALVHHFAPDTFDFKILNPKNRRGNFNLAFKVAEDRFDISPLLDVEDMIMMGDKPDWKCVFTYVQSFYRKLELEPRAKAAAKQKEF